MIPQRWMSTSSFFIEPGFHHLVHLNLKHVVGILSFKGKGEAAYGLDTTLTQNMFYIHHWPQLETFCENIYEEILKSGTRRN